MGRYTKEERHQMYLRDRERILAKKAAERRAAGCKEQHGLSGTHEYQIWANMKDRCYNKDCRFYGRYGGRGIKVYEPWLQDVEAFCKYMGPRPSPRHSLDRIDNSGNYEPGNVRWATYEEQNINRRKYKKRTFQKLGNDLRVCIQFWANAGIPTTHLAHIFQVSQTHVAYIAKNFNNNG